MIECQDVSFSYPASALPDSERQTGGALKHISCTIEDGSFVLLCGTSGCGKTTMTRLFNGLIPHYHEGTYTGSVYLDGKDTRDLSLFDISLKVGSVFQNPRSQFFNVDTAAFQQAYGIDLTTAKMHWWRFRALFAALPEDTRMFQILHARSVDLSRLEGAEREHYARMKEMYALPSGLEGVRPIHSVKDHDESFLERFRPREG